MAIAGKKRKRVSKKNKIAWRKHTKVQDVEIFLEEKQEEERLGPLESVTNDELFILDTKPQEQQQISSKERRKQRALRPVKCFSALVPHTKVPDPIAKRNRVRTPEERKSIFVKKKEEENCKNGILKAKEITAIAERRLNEIQREKKEKRGDFTKDLWGANSVYSIENDPWTEKNTKKHNLRGVGIPVKNITKEVLKKQSVFPAVEPPHPGMSYNPSFEDHQDLLKQITEKEEKLIKQEEHLQRVTRGMFKKVTETKRDRDWMVEMSQGLPDQEGSNTNAEIKPEEASDDENAFKISINPPVKNKKKTPQQRRKHREQLELEKARKALKLEKKKIGDIHRIKVVKNHIEKVDKKQEVLQVLRKKQKERKILLPKQLSRTKFQENDLEFNEAQDIAGNLRNLKKEGSLLTDRFKSLQKRNILEPARKAYRKKGKVKKYVRPGYKDDDWEKTISRAKLL